MSICDSLFRTCFNCGGQYSALEGGCDCLVGEEEGFPYELSEQKKIDNIKKSPIKKQDVILAEEYKELSEPEYVNMALGEHGEIYYIYKMPSDYLVGIPDYYFNKTDILVITDPDNGIKYTINEPEESKEHKKFNESE
jgi:hypothetical protein